MQSVLRDGPAWVGQHTRFSANTRFIGSTHWVWTVLGSLVFFPSNAWCWWDLAASPCMGRLPLCCGLDSRWLQGRPVGKRAVAPLEEVIAPPVRQIQERRRAVWALGAASCFPNFPGTAMQQPTQMSVGQASEPDAITENNFPCLVSGDWPCDPEDCALAFCSSPDQASLCPFFLHVS